MSLEIKSLTRKTYQTDSIALEVDELDLGSRIVRYVATSRGSEKRARTLLTKEPLTVPWIETIKPGEVYVDIGANVGMYAIYAGVVGAQVFAFEPEALNYAELNKNIYVNDLHGRVTAYCMAITDVIDVSVLHLSAFSFAGSHHDFGQNRWDDDRVIGGKLRSRSGRPQQGCVSFPLDELIARGVLPTPQHLKIDVDGFEYKVARGAAKTLASDELRTILLEVDFTIPESLAIVEHLTELGWRYSQDQIRVNQHEFMREGKIESLIERRKAGANFIFYKDSFYDDFFSDFAKDFVPPNPKPAKVTA